MSDYELAQAIRHEAELLEQDGKEERAEYLRVALDVLLRKISLSYIISLSVS